ncbi:tRNA uridine-5-carboxymethylaminomethyl(34) synthesis GTPase MnmE, partial [Candidatus Latescibacterota bacterium]
MPIGREVFRSRPPLGFRPRYVQFGHLCDLDGKDVDTGLAWVLPGPRSYTGEDTVEISGHGSDVVLEAVLAAAVGAGAAQAGPGEFTRRAFLNGRLDLVQAEAVVELIQAGGRQSVESAYGHVRGQLSQRVRELKDEVVSALS